jgi:hypothetical protein
MIGEPPEPAATPPGSGAGEQAPASADPSPPRERFGPLVAERHSKDDGRALILYSRVERETP